MTWNVTTHSTLAAQIADKAVLAAVESELLTPSAVDAAIEKLLAPPNEPAAGVETRRKRLEASIVKLDAELERLVAVLAAGAPPTLSTAVRECEAQRQRLRDELKTLNAAPALKQPDQLNVEACSQLDE